MVRSQKHTGTSWHDQYNPYTQLCHLTLIGLKKDKSAHGETGERGEREIRHNYVSAAGVS